MKNGFEVLNEALLQAGKTALGFMGRAKVKLKGRANLVTQADTAAQKKIISLISNVFPSHGFVAEEKQNNVKKTGRFIWVIDPIDGTTNYAHSFTHAAVSVALTDNGRPIMGGVYDFFKKELFTAVKGKGAELNGKKIRVSAVKKVQDSLLVTGFSYDRENLDLLHLPLFKEFLLASRDLRRTGSASLDLCWTAAGRLDGYWEAGLNPWDVCAGKLILEEAGGEVSDFYGRKWELLENYGVQTLASNGKIHKQMLSIFARTFSEIKRGAK